MDCPSLSQLEAVVDGEPDGEVSVHIEICPACRKQIEQVRANVALLSRLAGSSGDLRGTSGAGTDAKLSVPGYTILDELHRGGQGVVYRARQIATHRTVAVKVLLSGTFATSKQRRRFEREIELVAGLRHPNIVTVYDSGVNEDGRHWFAMEYLDGDTLDEYVAGHPLRLADKLRLFSRICGAVSYAHQHGVIHRDLKPANIIVGADDALHVLDFGLAKPVNAEIDRDKATVTTEGSFLGTLAYASPEQTTGDPNAIDVRSDVYALGVILYEMLCGEYPYPVTGRLSDVVDAIANTPPKRLRSFTDLPDRLDDEIETIALTALAKEPARRYQSAEALARDVEHYLAGEPIDAKRDSGWYVLRKTLGRYRLQAAAAGAFVLLLAGTSVAMSVLYQRAHHEAEKVRQINLFLEDTLGSAELPPHGELTVREMLDEGVHWIALALADQPEIEASVRGIIGSAYRNIGRIDEAEAQLQASLKIRREQFGDRHPQVAKGISGVGLVRMSQGRYLEAEALFTEALEIRRDAFGLNNLQVALALNNLANVKRARGELDEALRLYNDSYVIRLDRRGVLHGDTAMGAFLVGRAYTELGADGRAMILHQRALETRRAVLHEEHPDLARSRTAVAVLHLRLGNPDAAEPLLLSVLRRHEAVMGAQHWRTAVARRLYGECLAAAGRQGEADLQLQAAFNTLLGILGPDHAETRAATTALAAIKEKTP